MNQTTTHPASSTLQRNAPYMAMVAMIAGLGVAIAIARPAAGPDVLSPLAAVILGLVEGITEFLPVSSTGHLLVVQKLLGLGGTESSDLALDTYAICIQAGAILAVVVLYRERITQMLQGAIGRSEQGRQLLLATIAAFVPTVLIALALQDPIRSRLFGPGPIAVAWVVGGIAILAIVRTGLFDRGGSAITEITIRQAVIIGVAQSLALWPGMSRSLVTIIAAVLVGLSLAAAVEFSFILGLATLSAATLYEGMRNGGNLVDTFGVVTPAIGLVVAFVSAVVAVRWMVSWLQTRGFAIFGWYRIVAGLSVGVALAAGWL